MLLYWNYSSDLNNPASKHMKLEQTLLAVNHDDDRELACNMYSIDRQRLQNELAMIHQMLQNEDGPK